MKLPLGRHRGTGGGSQLHYLAGISAPKKIFSPPPPPPPNRPNSLQTPSRPPRPPPHPLLGEPPPSGIFNKNRPPSLPVAPGSPFPSPEQKKIKNIRNVHQDYCLSRYGGSLRLPMVNKQEKKGLDLRCLPNPKIFGKKGRTCLQPGPLEQKTLGLPPERPFTGVSGPPDPKSPKTFEKSRFGGLQKVPEIPESQKIPEKVQF